MLVIYNNQHSELLFKPQQTVRNVSRAYNLIPAIVPTGYNRRCSGPLHVVPLFTATLSGNMPSWVML
jgi:hypothetical protein